jgi:hypothetical protein
MEADMGRGHWLAGWLIVAGLTPGVAAGEAVDRPGLIVHLVELAQLPDRDLAVAKIEVERIFRVAGVDIVWAGHPIPIPTSVAAQHDCSHPHVVVFLTNSQKPASKRDEAGGEAVREIGRAYVFHNRIVAESLHHQTDPALVLGRAMAHEIGHLLLPPHSHIPFGIMQPNIDFAPVGLHIFESAQAQTIRTSLAGLAVEVK